MKRRQFITLLGGAAAWPQAARAQQAERIRRVGVLSTLTSDDAVGQARNAAFLQALQQLGWAVGRNVRIDYRWSGGNAEHARRYAAELVALAPAVILTTGSGGAGAVLQATRTVPIVFAHVPDPVGSGFVASLARPGGNATGFTQYEFGIGAKWLELIRQTAPTVRRAAVLRDPGIAGGLGHWGALQAVAPALGMEAVALDIRDAGGIEGVIAAFARSANGGLIVPGSALAIVNRDLIIALAARYKLPAVYYERSFVDAGGLLSYGADLLDQYRAAAGYIDRILKGEKPADLPVQQPTKFELVINLKTAKALGLEVPPMLLARADEVIE